MILKSCKIAKKDLYQVFSAGSGPIQSVLLGLLLVFVFSLSARPGQIISAQQAVAIFWLASCFGLVLICNALFYLEEQNEVRMALIMAPIPVQTIWLGKVLGSLSLLVFAQLFFIPAIFVFLGQTFYGQLWQVLVLIFAVDLGLSILGCLLGALAQGQGARDSLLTVILFPLLIPLLLGGISLGSGFLSPDSNLDMQSWAGIIAAFDILFAGAALILFPFVYSGE